MRPPNFGWLLLAAALALVLAACGGSAEDSDGSAEPPAASTQPAVSPEPSTGTEVVLSLPATAPAGVETAIPLIVTVGAGEVTWDTARLDLATEGPVSARYDLDLSGLSPGGSMAGHLTVAIDPEEALDFGTVTVTLELLDGDEVATARLIQLGLLSDDETIYFGFLGHSDLLRSRLRALLDAGEITQAEFDKAYEDTLEQVTGTVEQKDG